MDNKKFEIFKLNNGTEVILVPKSDSLATTVMTTATVGSKYEEKDISGISHFLEHMGFKGTKKRPTAMDISTELESLGSSYNASTSYEKTNYYAKVRNKHFDQALDIISDMYLNSTLPKEELEKERGVILEEINMYEDSPSSNVGDIFINTLYGDQPAGWPILGRKEVIKNLQRQDFVNYKEKYYGSGNTIITVAGGYDKNSIKEKLESAFTNIKKDSKLEIPKVKNSQEKPNETIKHKDSDQAHLVLGFKAFDVHDEREMALRVLSGILGGGMSSRLFHEIRAKRGLAYYIYSSTGLYTNNGFIAAQAGVNKNKAEEAVKVILEEFSKLKTTLISEEEINKTKENIIGSTFLNLETSSSLANYYTSQRAKNLTPLTPEDFAEKINKVSAQDIQNVAKDILNNKNLNLAVIGPFKNKSFGDILEI